MIDHKIETVLSLTEAAARLPRRRGGKRPNVATLYRWASRGCRGVRLETLQVGGTRCTSVEALQRFFERLSNDRDPVSVGGDASRPAPVLGPHRRDPETAAELERLGL